MKVTVSSTSMMKPMLYTQSNIEPEHPQRIVGLLEQTDKEQISKQTVIYHRPDATQENPERTPWQHFLHIPDNKSQPCVAVFGFDHDGERTWYQLWNHQTKQVNWVLQQDGMDYQPYAILAMDALVSLLPNWNGELFWSLSSVSEPESSAHHQTYFRQTNRQFDLLISDAVTTSNGKLWFLVTVQNERTELCEPVNAECLRTGWISQNSTDVRAMN